jgi:transposase-like protein
MRVMNELSCLLKILTLCRGRRDGWVSVSEPPKLMRPGCPRCGSHETKVHRKHRNPVLDYRCADCRKVFNCFTGTPFQGTHRTPSELVKLVIGVVKRMSSKSLARMNGWQRSWLATFRRRLDALAWVEALREKGEDPRHRANGLTLRDLGRELDGVQVTCPVDANAHADS